MEFRKLVIRYRRPVIVLLHLSLVALSNYLAFLLRFDGAIPPLYQRVQLEMLPWLVAVRGLVFIRFRLYEGLWRYAGLWDLMQIIAAVAVSSVAFGLLLWSPLATTGYPRSVPFIDAMVLVCLLGGTRMGRRAFKAVFRTKGDKRVLIYGAGDAGELLVRDMQNNASYESEPVGFIDDDPAKVDRRIHGVPVLGTRHDLASIIAKRRVREVLIAIPTAQPAVIRGIVAALSHHKVRITTLPNFRDLLDGKVAISQIRNLSVEDLLTRAPVGLDPQPIRHLINGRRVLVTGAGGSIGSELCRQILTLAPKQLLLLERYENSLFAITNDLKDRGLPGQIEALVGDVTDFARVDSIMSTYRPEIVFHAAAHKHVPLMEEHPCEAVKNNIGGTRILAEAAELYGVDRFIFVSTDKAVNPTSVMGATKRLGELLLQSKAGDSSTVFLAVRFGNVLGSNGSVVPRFIEQIRSGGPVTVTHPEVQRYFMLIREAVQLVLHAAAEGSTAGVYVLEMGDQIKILDMARNVIRLMGHIPDEEIPIAFTGLRPGEKLFEELVWSEERVVPSSVQKVLRVEASAAPDTRRLRDQLRDLESLAREQDESATRRQLAEMVPFYQPTDEPARVPRPVLTPVTAESPSPEWSIAQRCPHCHTESLYRSHARGPWERMRKTWSVQRLFRCHECGWRGWADWLEPSAAYQIRDMVGQDLDLAGSTVPAKKRSEANDDIELPRELIG